MLAAICLICPMAMRDVVTRWNYGGIHQADEAGVIQIDPQAAQESIQQRAVRYDKDMDEHYDTISAFIVGTRPDPMPHFIGWR